MALNEIKTEVIKLGNNFAIPLPIAFCEGVNLQEGTALRVISKQGKLEIQITDVEDKVKTCQICDSRPGKYTCSICGTFACSNCFWEFGQLCNNCTKRKND